MKKLNLYDIKTLELDLLINFDKFCKENNLIYFIAYGTLLGAIRHGGFIPWDDDIDIQMPRTDYEKFLTLRDKYESSFYGNVIKTLGDKGYPFPFTKIENKNTLVIEHKMTTKIKTGVWVDIFPMDGLPKYFKKI